MPTYEYECKSCGHTFDAFQSMNDEPLKTCPKCGKDVRRLINGGSGIIFKGSGFYVTDKKGSGGSSPASPSPAAKSPEAAPGGGAKTDGAAKTDAGTKTESSGEKKAAS
ncbi:MAG: zinc ribbon domain-containing protein [Treponema sp.]|jgi:putative FmdB family regulatory protein|nr:zinc ribbon domain-containing protein [Treponema sp.]